MPEDNRIAIQIPEADVTEINAAIETLKTKLQPYLIALTPEDRKMLPKMSDKTIPFVDKALDYAQNSPQFAPQYMNVPEMKIDLDALNTLTEFYRPLEQIISGFDDTMMLSGSEAYIAALSYYNSVKMAAKMNVPAAKPIYDDLKERFNRKSKTAVSPDS
ncbi:MAG: hypothetical protein CMF23_00235 [Ignavibacteriae bacterium]|nr:hypothetical protein [Ignavibacteriota bacterium]